MTTLDKPTQAELRHTVELMQKEKQLWDTHDPRQGLEINSEAVLDMFTQLAEIGQCVLLDETYIVAWMINPQWFNPNEFTIQELAVVKIADGGGTIRDVVKYFRGLSLEYGSRVMIGDLLSSRQFAYGALLNQAGARPYATAYTV